MPIIKLFCIFVKIGAILLGGGYVILPILQNEFVEKRNLISQDDLLNYFALSQTLPGIIAANISIFIGYKLRGKIGAITAMLGVISVPFLTIIIIASLINSFTQNSIIQSVLWGIGIAVIALILLTVREIWQNSQKDKFFYFILSVTVICLILLKLSPISVILSVSLLGLIVKTLERRLEK